MITCTRRLTFCAGHRVFGHESKCSHLHGHNYVVEVEAYGKLDSIGRIIDFSVLKQLLGGWLEDHWDHGFIVYEHDERAVTMLSCFYSQEQASQKLYLMPTNPTAENMAVYLLKTICPMLFEDKGIVVKSITIHETENCHARADIQD